MVLPIFNRLWFVFMKKKSLGRFLCVAFAFAWCVVDFKQKNIARIRLASPTLHQRLTHIIIGTYTKLNEILSAENVISFLSGKKRTRRACLRSIQFSIFRWSNDTYLCAVRFDWHQIEEKQTTTRCETTKLWIWSWYYRANTCHSHVKYVKRKEIFKWNSYWTGLTWENLLFFFIETVAVAVAFFLCWAPFHAQRIMAVYGKATQTTNDRFHSIYTILTYVSGVLYFLSTCINPLLYSIMSHKFRDAFRVSELLLHQNQNNWTNKKHLKRKYFDTNIPPDA